MKRIFIIVCVFFTTTYSISLFKTLNPLNEHAHVVKKVFTHSEISLKFAYQEDIIKTFNLVYSLPVKDLILSLEALENLLERQEKKYQDPLPSSPRSEVALTILAVQKEHIKNYTITLYNRLAWWEKILVIFYKTLINSISHCRTWLSSSYISYVKKCADQFFWYTHFEREHLLADYHTAMHFFVQQRKNAYPPAFYFWKEEPDKVKVLTLLHKLDTKITVQGEGFLVDVTEDATEDAVEATGVNALGETMDAATLDAAKKAAEEAEAAANRALFEEAGFGDMEVEALVEEFKPKSIAYEIVQEVIKGAGEQATQTVVNQAEAAARLKNPPTSEDSLDTNETNEDPSSLETAIEEEGATPAVEGADPSEPDIILRKTGQARLDELNAERNQKLEELEKTIKNPKATVGQRLKARTQRRWMKMTRPLSYISDRGDAYITSHATKALQRNLGKTAAKLENNPLRQIIKGLPPAWQGVAEMMIQMEAMQASSIVQFWYEQDNEKEYQEWQKTQANLASLNTRFTALMTVQQHQNLTVANQSFLKNCKQLSLDKFQQQGIAIFSQKWIEQAIFSSPPSSYFIDQATAISNNNFPAIDSDYKFQLSTMITPETLATPTFNSTAAGAWRNIYRTGNWQFLPSQNAFYQLALAPINGSTTAARANQALSNSIFKEYVPKQQLSYPVAASCTLYTYQFPFFVGLLFNKGRWISGIPDREQQTRFAGLYGTADKKIYFVCQESKNSSAQEITQGAPSTQSPFYRILSDSQTYEIASNAVTPPILPATFTINTLSYDMTHPTLANTVTAQLQFANSKTPYSISNNLFSVNNGLQHGIGFVSAGCIATFTLQGPLPLVYTPAQLNMMNKNLLTLISTPQGGS